MGGGGGGVKQVISSAHYPQCNGQDEHTNQRAMVKYSNSTQTDWDDYIGSVTYAINITRQATIKMTTMEVGIKYMAIFCNLN